MPENADLASWFDRIASSIGAPVGDVLLRSTLLLLLAFALDRILRRVSAASRHLLWAATFVGLALVPPLVWFGPEVGLPVLPAAEHPSTPTAAITGHARQPTSVPASTTAAAPASASPVTQEIASPTVGSRSSPHEQQPWIAWFWTVGALGALMPLLLGLLRLQGIGQPGRATPPDPGWQHVLARTARRLGITRPIRLSLSAHTRAPMTWGLVRPEVLLPRTAEGWSLDLRRTVLAHELSHVARRDWAWHLLSRVVCALYWPHPLVWMASRRLALEAERACDDRASGLGTGPLTYAEHLLTLAGDAVRPRAGTLALTMSGRRHLHTRMTALLDPHQRRTPMRRAHALTACTSALVVIAALATSHLVAAPAYDDDVRPLLEAAARGDVESVRAALETGLDPDGAIRGEGTALIRAASGGHGEVVALLLERGADPSRTETAGGPRRWQRSPLGAATLHGDRDLVTSLLDAGADIEQTPRGDASPLIIAARAGHASVVELLLDEGADPNRTIRGDGAPLIAASAGGHDDVVALLLDRGARPDVFVRGDGTALIRATAKGDRQIAARLLEAGADPDQFVRGDGTPLIQAVRSGNIALVEQLLLAGADPNKRARGDGSPLIRAAARGDQAMVDLLIAHGAKPDRDAPGDGNALIQAAARGDEAMVTRLLDAGADPDAAVRGDGSPLIAAAARGHLPVVSLLLDRNASIDQVVPGDETALITAAWNGRRAVVELLLDHGADVNLSVRAQHGRAGSEVRSPLSQARRGGHAEVEALLRTHGAED